ncbi:hypothetical protein LWI28_008285 [Acer negundo]|uniref:F-box domain-containing protein n=1 Tax=Acer negundo TaxID=4023 RepID=A0AAD5P4T6_ACENE|nr:hypothetical protein LWI28_008285 [Acer negundo]
MATLPPELIMDILSYLPVKSLCRFSFLNTKSYEKLKVHPLKLDVLKENPDEYWNGIFGSNGLFCLRDKDDDNEAFFIYNLFTRESKKVFYPIHIDHWPPLVGFGYAESIDDYKFVKVMSTEILHIFSLKNNSWKTIEIDFPIANWIGTSRKGIALNGAIHWSGGILWSSGIYSGF